MCLILQYNWIWQPKHAPQLPKISPRREAPCITCSFQAEDMAVLWLLRELKPDIPVLFLETGYHFPEVYAYRDEMTRQYGLNLVNVMPEQTVPEQESQFGILYQTAPDQCCKLRKVGPLFKALANHDVWFTGLRRVQSPTRANLAVNDVFPLPGGKQIRKISPLAAWTDRDVWQFAQGTADPAVVALRPGLHQHRMPALHGAASGSRESAFRTLGRSQARMRNPHRGGLAWQSCWGSSSPSLSPSPASERGVSPRPF